MIVSKTPLRMSFVGGGSDIPAFFKEEIGAVLSTSIDKYMYICVNEKFDGRIRINYSKTEEVERVSDIQHPLVRESLAMLGLSSGLEIASLADIPSKGAGLGSSSSYTVGLLNALYCYSNKMTSKEILARKACEIEIVCCGEPIGKQDQYAASFGGLNLFQFNPDDTVVVNPVVCRPDVLHSFEESIIVFFTGRTRSASEVLLSQSAALKNKESKVLVRKMVNLAFVMKEELETGNLSSIGELLNENWFLKSQLSKGITDSQIDEWYIRGIKSGALGGKLLGAGNGGFLMFYAPKELHLRISKSLAELKQVKFSFDYSGSQIIYK